MRERMLKFFFLGYILFVTVFVFIGCKANDENENEPNKLSTPIVVLTGNQAIWDANNSADKFEISLDGTLLYLQNSITSKILEDGQSFMIRAIGDGINNVTSEWSNKVTYTYVDTLNSKRYTVIWKCGNDIIETDENVIYGTMPTYDGQVPTRKGDEKSIYVFSGWNMEVSTVTADVTYYATFVDIVEKHIVFFCDNTGYCISAQEVLHGETATAPSPPVLKNHIFLGWDTDFSNVKSDLYVTAKYMMQFNVKFETMMA